MDAAVLGEHNSKVIVEDWSRAPPGAVFWDCVVSIAVTQQVLGESGISSRYGEQMRVGSFRGLSKVPRADGRHRWNDSEEEVQEDRNKPRRALAGKFS